MIRKINFFGVLLVALLITQALMAAEYNVTASTDYTGPYAVVMPAFDPTNKALFDWWNETKGRELGIKLVQKVYDMRYDPSVMASLWPGILTKDKPIAHEGLGAPDVAALMKRLPDDKVPLLLSTAALGFTWTSNTWVFFTRPTYSHEAAGFFNWVHMNQIKDRPVKVGIVSSNVSPGFIDLVDGFKAFAKKYPWVEVVGIEWVPLQPLSVATEVRRLSTHKPDFLWVPINTAHVVQTIKAQKELGIQIPILMATHNGIEMSAAASKNMALLNGHYDVGALDPGFDPTVPCAVIVDKYCKKLNLKTIWNPVAVQMSINTLLAFRAIERAAAMAGPDHITGEAVYKAMFLKPFTEEDLLGLAPSITFSKDAPFPKENAKVKASTVKDGKHVMVTNDWLLVPEIPNWTAEK